jgi:FixJ family two-component response regulator
MKPVVFVIDDDFSMREALQGLLCSVGHQVEVFASTQEFVQASKPDVTSCLVLDVRLPGRSGLEFQRDLVNTGIFMPIIFITGHGDIPMSVAAMKAGAIEFLTKPFRHQELLDAVHRGFELSQARRTTSDAVAKVRGRFDTLTRREREVMALVAAGQMNKQIAARLDLSEITVKVHRAQVMEKMKAASIADLVRMADSICGAMPKT